MNFLSYIKDYKGIIVLILFVLFLTVTFETSQQLFYLKRFNLSDEATFFYLLKNQAYRWIIWLLLSGFIFWYVKSNSNASKISASLVFKYLGLIIGLVIMNIFIISVSQLITYDIKFSLQSFISEYMQFFMYQKAPMYTLGYIAITVIMHLYYANEKLHVKIQNLSELKVTNEELYRQLKRQIDDKSSILNIKIGNKRKIVPVIDITWIEADDYCVKVHTITNETYTMRSSLKALEEKLDTNFIRVHRKALVNMNFTEELYTSSSSTHLTLKNKIQIPVSKKNLKIVRNFIN
ncbi:LytTR family DNA-binding domain-containing protein [uncultured Winogradskyella sp.]|uniref:LytR/AlgR family response regulator transcription factor n=1 Tax=uncultured Winogradskyella sp. TaxID=395353 RepID=UPI00263921C7|nr:LytTR family DNA-binding domain-containing protein [uncultured Winogradskyella sp.]